MKKHLLSLLLFTLSAPTILSGAEDELSIHNKTHQFRLIPEGGARTRSTKLTTSNRLLLSSADKNLNATDNSKAAEQETPQNTHQPDKNQNYFLEDTVIDDSDPTEQMNDTGSEENSGLDETKFIMSRFTGTFVGFGTGHAIQGRWLSHGWIFTLGDLLTWPVITLVWPLYGRGKNYRAGAALWFLIHGIEVWDLWSYTGDDPEVMVKPISVLIDDKKHYGLSLSWNF